jgi:glycosyltransferase involved in cell wall biosynthesis
MPKWLFIGPTLLAGIGQVTKRYSEIVNGDYTEILAHPNGLTYDYGFAFLIPVPAFLDAADRHLAQCRKKIIMTVCETETVHPVYGELVRRYKTIYVPSSYCQTILKRQFPDGIWNILRHTALGSPLPPPKTERYTFYTIGNMLDPRKNIQMLLDSFRELNIPDVRLVLKATCKEVYKCNVPGVLVMNGLLTDEQLESVHSMCHCYVNCSFSEGVGMGAVEAAMRDKPVILTEYGGLKEYIPSSPFVISSGRTLVGNDDFLYTKDMVWGLPVKTDLVRYMRKCATEKIVSWDHSATRQLVGEVGSFFSSQ